MQAEVLAWPLLLPPPSSFPFLTSSMDSRSPRSVLCWGEVEGELRKALKRCICEGETRSPAEGAAPLGCRAVSGSWLTAW